MFKSRVGTGEEKVINSTHKPIQDKLLDKIKILRDIDKRYMLDSGYETPPHLDIHRFCTECNQIVGVSATIGAEDMDEIREAFLSLLVELLKDPTECPRCGEQTIPLGYAWTSLGWMLEGFNNEDIDRYYRVIGTIKSHPSRIEIFQTTVSTMIGMKRLMISKIIRKKEKIISFGEDETMDGGGGRLLIDLPQYTEDMLRNGVEEEQ